MLFALTDVEQEEDGLQRKMRRESGLRFFQSPDDIAILSAQFSFTTTFSLRLFTLREKKGIRYLTIRNEVRY